jgi:hypothetical protein
VSAPTGIGAPDVSPCLNPTDDGKLSRGVSRKVSTADCVAINGRNREGRQGQRRIDVRSQNTTIGMFEIDNLNVL